MNSKRFLFLVVSALISVFTGCQIQMVSGVLNGIWTESYSTSSGGQVVLTLTFIEESASFTWIEKEGDLEKNNRTGTYSVYLNDSLADKNSRATLILQFAASADGAAKNVAFWFSFSEKDGKTYLNLKPVSESEDTYVLLKSTDSQG